MEEKQCEYCGETTGIVQCQCGKHFCNGKIMNAGVCQLLHHMRVNSHFSVSFNGVILKCSKCEETNIYNLHYKYNSKDFLCSHCLKSQSKINKRLYSKNIVNEGAVIIDNYDVGQSVSCVKQDLVDKIEAQFPKEKTEKRVKNEYPTLDDYVQTYLYLSRIEKKEERSVVEVELRQEKQRIKFIKHPGFTTVEINLPKAIGGLQLEDEVIISCGGLKGMVNDTNSTETKLFPSLIFKSSKCVFGGNITSSRGKTVVVRLQDFLFGIESTDYKTGTTTMKYPTNEEKWKYNEEIVKKTSLFRIYFLTNDKGNPFIRTLDVLQSREIDGYYSKILCCNKIQLTKTKEIITYEEMSEEKYNIPNLSNLNDYQTKAIYNALNEDISLVIGPPGTGKTTVAVSIAQYLIYNKRRFYKINRGEKKLLVCASSNNAVDVICSKLIEKGIPTVRVVADEQFENCSDKIRENSLLKKAIEFTEKKGINEVAITQSGQIIINSVLVQRIKKQIQNKKTGNGFGDNVEFGVEFDDVSNDESDDELEESKIVNIRELLKKKYGQYPTEDENREVQKCYETYLSTPINQIKYGAFENFVKQTNSEIQKIIDRVSQRITLEENRYINNFTSTHFDDILSGIECVCSTLTICTRSIMLKQKFFASIVDEAAQSLEPETLAGIINVRKTVLIGDIQQLQPTCLSTEAREAGFQKSMFERFMANTQIKRTMLKTQYRMHPAISEFSNKMFYSSKLENGVSSDDRFDDRIINFFPDYTNPIMFINCDGTEHYGSSGTSYNNAGEVQIIQEVVEKLLNNDIEENEIGIISPYQAQQELISQYVSTKIKVANIDGFQGNEKEYIIFSCVRSNQTLGVGFVNDYKRLNVALTRAKSGLIIIGNIPTLITSKVWNMLIHQFYLRDALFELKEHDFVQYNVENQEEFNRPLEKSPFQVQYEVDDSDLCCKPFDKENEFSRRELNDVWDYDDYYYDDCCYDDLY
ncbi:regulator of nonsense transcripts putative [Entamoeba histolytica]|uniref:Regulator of nonsense transcripts, putative n=2 Tax=Entamoeba histolytica TaxID=5759 RepID=C4M5S7_ENTH1|nr:regulator of nonsense transcripts, putative [Entamoeba histolytica HM-1:IMSS]EAL49041.2 regulator of nonsense transcripts, putative [Entamoeba histolytica HM-1:IMSS]GAT96801.1 regulator of nonsense transcripts putative [Entamoeba histolytica]|eukprot:XP_654409.2 regulator of nonsense transcripts, putative [Entamoeba histolytica HM-1:IMSS]